MQGMLPRDRAQGSSLCHINREGSCALGASPLQLGIAPPWGSPGRGWMPRREGSSSRAQPAAAHPGPGLSSSFWLPLSDARLLGLALSLAAAASTRRKSYFQTIAASWHVPALPLQGRPPR